MNQTLSLIASRRSHRSYLDKQITQEELTALLDAAVASPSAVNRQPWHFSAVQNEDLLNEINAATRENMMKKAESERSPRFADEAFHVFYHAPTVIFVSGDTQSIWGQLDCGIAVQNIVLAAESLGLGTVILGLPREAFQTEKAEAFRKVLCFPEGYNFMLAISVGYPHDTKAAHPVHENKISIIR